MPSGNLKQHTRRAQPAPRRLNRRGVKNGQTQSPCTATSDASTRSEPPGWRPTERPTRAGPTDSPRPREAGRKRAR